MRGAPASSSARTRRASTAGSARDASSTIASERLQRGRPLARLVAVGHGALLVPELARPAARGPRRRRAAPVASAGPPRSGAIAARTSRPVVEPRRRAPGTRCRPGSAPPRSARAGRSSGRAPRSRAAAIPPASSAADLGDDRGQLRLRRRVARRSSASGPPGASPPAASPGPSPAISRLASSSTCGRGAVVLGQLDDRARRRGARRTPSGTPTSRR